MIGLKLIQENPELVISRLAVKNFDAAVIINEIKTLDETRRETQHKLDGLQNEMNTLSREIGNLFKSGQKEKAEEYKQQTVVIKEEIQKLTQKLEQMLSGRKS